MRSRYTITDADGVYFLTSTIVEWLPVFTGVDACDTIIQSLEFCRKAKGLRVYAYVIMENHIHLVADTPDLGRVMQSFKRHTAKELVQLAEASRKEWLLNQWAYYRKKYKVESAHQIWQEGSHPQLVLDDDMLRQKIRYVHENPVRRGYVDLAEHWRYSSARNYFGGESPVMEVDVPAGW